MNQTWLDKFIEFFSPRAAMQRYSARVQSVVLKRQYDAATTFKFDDWASATSTSVNKETKAATQPVRNKARDAVRNNPVAVKALNTIVNTTIGWGIEANIKGRNASITRRLQELWKVWADTTLCDIKGRNNFYSLQSIAMRAIVESGEVICLKQTNRNGNQLLLLESDYIDSNRETNGYVKDANGNVDQGVVTDSLGNVVGYYLHTSHPGDSLGTGKSVFIPSSDVIHAYREERPGQKRGISWFHAVLNTLEDLKEYQRATIIKQKISACLSVFVSKPAAGLGLTSDQLKTKRESDFSLEPASVYYLDDGEQVTFSNPPAVQGYDEFCKNTLRMVSSGLGITYEQLTGDYSNVNFSSGRMGNLEMRKNIDAWRWNMFIPMFCDPAFRHFLQWAQTEHIIDTTGVTVEWICPAWSMIDPEKEINASVTAIRSGLTTTPKVIREMGYDPNQILVEQEEWNKQVDEMNLILDSDPRKQTKAGQAQSISGGNNGQQTQGSTGTDTSQKTSN